MPDYFHFRADDPYITTRLTQEEINGVRRWQAANLDYEFSFHTQHEAGHPCYLSEPDGPRRNLPKINVRETSRHNMLQSGSIKTPACGEDFEGVITANLALFQKLAEQYYALAQARQRAPKWIVEFTCNKETGRWNKSLTYLFPEDLSERVQQGPNTQEFAATAWPNFKAGHRGTYVKPSCPQHKTTACFVDHVRLLQANSTEKLTGYVDWDGELINVE